MRRKLLGTPHPGKKTPLVGVQFRLNPKSARQP
jgi:hypothetical protein